jgi:hypothetical protein
MFLFFNDFNRRVAFLFQPGRQFDGFVHRQAVSLGDWLVRCGELEIGLELGKRIHARGEHCTHSDSLLGERISGQALAAALFTARLFYDYFTTFAASFLRIIESYHKELGQAQRS